MKRKNIILVMLVVFAGIFSMQSCVKQDDSTFTTFHAFTDPTVVAPLDQSFVNISGATLQLKWASTNADGDPILGDVYFGTDPKPALYKAGNNALTLTVPVTEGSTYYWQVVMKDKNGITSTGPVWSFSVLVNYDINNFVGVFDCDEPGYKHYDCNFTKISANTVSNDNFWDSGWAVKYVFDDKGEVNIIPVSYVDKTTTYDITGSGKFNNTAKRFYVDYVVKNHATGATVDSNTHTFVKK